MAASYECPACEGSGGLTWDRTGGMAQSCHFCDESGELSHGQVGAVRKAVLEQERRDAALEDEMNRWLEAA